MNTIENCPECGSAIKTVPAGISHKSGQPKPYNEFKTCSNKECSWKPQSQSQPQPQPQIGGNEEVLKGLREIWTKLDTMQTFMFENCKCKEKDGE